MTGDRGIEAAEYILGTLDPGERVAFAQRLAGDPTLQKEVAELSRRFTELLDPLDPTPPSPEVWNAIRRRIDAQSALPQSGRQTVVVLKRPRSPRRFAIGSLTAIAALLVVFVATRDAIRWPGYGGSQAVQVAQDQGHASPLPRDGHDTIASVSPTESAEPATAPASPRVPEGSRPREGSVSMAGAKPGLGSVSTADEVHQVGSSQTAPLSADPDSVSPSAATVAARDASTPVTAYVAVLAGGGKNVLTVHLDPRTRSLRVGPVAVDIPAGKSLQLWYSRNGGAFKWIGPVADSPTELAMPADMAADGSVIGASLEPLGGAMSDGPTAPIMYQGQMRRE